MIEALFFIPVGPNDGKRVVYAVESIRMHCKNYKIYLLIDGPDPSSLPSQLTGPDICIQVQSPSTKGNGGKIWLMYCLAMSRTLGDPDLSPQAIFIKMDADALVLRAGLTERAQAIFATRPAVGQLGQCFSDVCGRSTPSFGWGNFMRKIVGLRGLRRCLLGAMETGEGWQMGFSAFFDIRALIKRAMATGRYRLGEYALGGAFILRKEVVEAIDAEGWLRPTPFRFLIYGKYTAGAEDIIMTPYVYAVGYSAMDDVSDGGIFGIEGGEFRVDPFVLKARGHYIIHPIKHGHKAHGHTLTEAELVAALNNYGETRDECR